MLRFISAGLVSVCLSSAVLGHEFEQYFIDGNGSTFSYQGSAWTESECRNAPCEFRLDGSFEASVGEWGTQYRNLSLSISGHSDSASSLVATAEGAFLSAIPNVLLPGQVGHPSRLGIASNSNGVVVGGSSVSIRASAVSHSALDCNSDGNLSLDDVNCHAGQQHFGAVFSALQLRPGDFDGDGSVEFGDFLVLSKQFGEAGRYVDGDADGNGTVEFGDFLILSSNFGAASAPSSVPEPSAGLWLPTLLLATTLFRKKR